MQSGERFLELWMMKECGHLNTLVRIQLDYRVAPQCPALNPFGFHPMAIHPADIPCFLMLEVQKTRDNNKMASDSSNCSDHGCLPPELITDILFQLPVKSLGRFKSVCKSWNSLISTHNFAKSHVQFQISSTSNNPSALTSVLLISPHPGFVLSCDLKLLNGHSFDAAIDAGLISPLKLGFPLPSSTTFPPLGSCCGLVCIVETMSMTANSKTLCVFNPTTKEFRYIPFPNTEDYWPARHWASGLGFVPSFDDYKIVLLKQTVTFIANDRVYHNTADVFSLRDGQWKVLDSSNSNLDASLGGAYLHTRSPAVWSNEALYWVVPSFPVGPLGSFFILEFNLAKERFSRAANVEHIRDADDRIMYDLQNLSIGVIAQKHVCVGQIYSMQSGEQFLEMWMMKKFGELNRLFILQLGSDITRRNLRLLGFTPNGLVWLVSAAPGRQEILLLDPSQNRPAYVLFAEKYVHHVMSYTPSLLSPS
ncbi:hypothetical protein Cgig2_028362 [Carnegiea gigantea]|uniref:F-box domain-containing protein n=1 Tax=Carnegiea gigantea TaxID=171969 RepID=A0A9Q1K116_9CARY|nr:hypothetical protein Cgig2_028362 [Carnegiea gigantea]